MALKLVFLGRLEDAAGQSERDVAHVPSFPQLLTGLESELVAALADPRIRLAVNGEIVSDRNSLLLDDGDELAFLPPVSGG
jgi:molybdopterin synthase sulfur carrier subunit